MAKLITVFGATGAQGGPIAKRLLQNGFKVRAVTRNPDSEKAKALKEAGAEVVAGNLDDIASVKAAVSGVYGVFYVTNYWELFGRDPATAYDREIAQGKAVADECKAAGVQHVVYSGLDAVKEKIGKPCPDLDAKAVVEKYLDEIGVPNTAVRFSYYYDNFIAPFPPAKQDDGTYTITMNMDGPMDAMAVADGAHIVLAVFQNRQEYLGKKVAMSGDKKTIAEYAAIISSVTGKTVRYVQVSSEQFRNQPSNPAAEDIASMFEYFSYGKPSYDVESTRKIYPGILTFQQWAEQNKEKL